MNGYIELINRTNQLNYTKKRLSGDLEKAKEYLRQQLSYFWVHAGLVRVYDKYGDYGYVGFFLTATGNAGLPKSLLHFCFSCRTLGMKVERWIYDWLGRPAIDIVQPVLTDLDEALDVDWIRFGVEGGDSNDNKISKLPKIFFRGGCEVNALSHYFSRRTDVCVLETSFGRTPFFVRKDFTSHLLLPVEVRSNPAWRQFARDCGFEDEDFESSILVGDHPEGSIIIYAGWGDRLGRRYKHRVTGQTFFPFLPNFSYILLSKAEKELEEFERVATSMKLSEEDRKKIKTAINCLAAEADFVSAASEPEIIADLEEFFARIAPNCICFVLMTDEFVKRDNSDTIPDEESVPIRLRHTPTRYSGNLLY